MTTTTGRDAGGDGGEGGGGRGDIAVSGPDFAAWLEAEGLTLRAAEDALGIGSRHSLIKYQREGAPRLVALAMSAYSAGLKPWSRK